MFRAIRRKVFYGDGTRIDLLHRAGADEADAILFCMDDRSVDAESLMPVRETFPNARLFVRAFDRRQMLELMPTENISIVREVFESSVHMANEALTQLDVSEMCGRRRLPNSAAVTSSG